MQAGYIKLHRKLLEWCWYDDDTVFRLFIHILLKANYRTVKWHDITIERGQLITSTVKLSEQLHRSRNTIKSALDKLVESGTITVATTNRYTLITIIGFEKYQSDDDKKANSRNGENCVKIGKNPTAKPTTDCATQNRSERGIAGKLQQQIEQQIEHQVEQQIEHQTDIRLSTSKEVKEYKEEKEYKEVSSTGTAPPTTTTEQDLIALYGIEATERYKQRFQSWAKKKNAKVDCIETIAVWMSKDGVPKKTAEAMSSLDVSAIDDEILAQYGI